MTAPRILIIEDNEANLELMTYLLNAFGYATETARDGRAGLDRIREGGAEVVVCDVQLPGLDGYELIAEARRTGSPVMPFVAVTAFARERDRTALLAAGFDGYIAKPIVPETFVDEIAAFLPPARRVHVDAAPAVPPISRPERRASVARQVLVVDDVAANAELVRSLLEPFGHVVTAAASVGAALGLVDQARPDLIVCDVHLADGSGYEVLARIRSEARLQDVPFVLLSSSARGPTERARAEARGAHQFIVRPIEAADLLKALRDHLEGS